MKEADYPEFDESILTISGNEVVCPVKTTPLHEFKFRNYCQKNGVVCYLPLCRTWKVHNVTSNGKSYNYSKEVLRPMFISYVFVKTLPEKLKNLFESKQIIRILPIPDLPAFMEEVRTVRQVELVGYKQELEFHEDIVNGDRFLIQSGIWEGVTGWLTCRDKKFKWTVQIEFLHQLITTSINPSKFKMVRLD